MRISPKYASALRNCVLWSPQYLHWEIIHLEKVVSCSTSWLASEQPAAPAATKGSPWFLQSWSGTPNVTYKQGYLQVRLPHRPWSVSAFLTPISALFRQGWRSAPGLSLEHAFELIRKILKVMTMQFVSLALALPRYFLDLISQMVEMAMRSLDEQPEEDGIRESSIDNCEFVPLDYLERIINNENIKIELGIKNGACTDARKPSNLPDRITKQAKKIFGALVLMGKADKIEGLLDEGLTDDHLPLSRDPKYDAVLSRDGATSFQFGCLGRQTITEFIKRKQWLFLAPILDTNGELIEVNYESALPFTDSEVEGHGAAGIVHRAKIYEGHQRGFEVSALSYEPNLQNTKVFRRRQSIIRLL